LADAFSRNAILNSIATVSSYKTKLEDKIDDGAKMDKDYEDIKNKIRKNESENLKTDYDLNEKGLILYKNRLYVPNIP